MMDYQKFCAILNRHIFEGEKRELLKKVANRPERFIGLFRPSKPKTKILQHLSQSHEIRFGDAFEELIEEILKDLGYKILPKSITTNNGGRLSLDQYFTDGKNYYFIEQKIRDDHDSTKKRGQIENFERKLGELFKIHRNNLTGIMYFIDPDVIKNKNFYIKELERLKEKYNVHLHLFYANKLFEFLDASAFWETMMNWLIQWKESIPGIPEINFDTNPKGSFEEIRNLEINYWKKLLENEKLWKEGIIKAIFNTGQTLELILEFFTNQKSEIYKNLSTLLKNKLHEYYNKH